MRAVRGTVAARVRKYFTDAPGLDVYVDDIVKTTGFSRKQVLNALSHMRTKNEPLITVISGRVYKFDPTQSAPTQPAQTDGDLHLMKLVGVLQGGETLFQNTETAELWKATRL